MTAIRTRSIDIHKVTNDDYLQQVSVQAVSEPGAGGANIHYDIQAGEGSPMLRIKFQEGNPAQEINGIPNEALLSIVIDRLQGFQRGDFGTRETAVALTNLETALMWMQKRTRDRIDRGVIGELAV